MLVFDYEARQNQRGDSIIFLLYTYNELRGLECMKNQNQRRQQWQCLASLTWLNLVVSVVFVPYECGVSNTAHYIKIHKVTRTLGKNPIAWPYSR